MTVEAIIFDFDGVIIDTETPDYEVWQVFYQSHGLDLSVDLWLNRTGVDVTSMGFDPVLHFHALTGNELAQAIVQAQHQTYLDRCAAQPLLAGVAETLQAARQRGLKLAIASNSDHAWVDRWLNQHDLLSYFDCVRCRDDVQAGKPAPDLYLSAAACLDVPVDRCIAIEDSPTGMKAALAAGIRCVAIPNQMTARLNHPEVALTLSSLAELDLQKLLTQF
jgi:HAD superfamily hydrolase (TIGR01509 family)